MSTPTPPPKPRLAVLYRLRWRAGTTLRPVQTVVVLLCALPFVIAGFLVDALFVGDINRDP